MPMLRATRQEISDRFSVLGFNVRTDGRRWFEVVLATNPTLFVDKSNRTSTNFFSTRSSGPLLAERSEAVYLVPPQVLQRFVGQERIYYRLATFADADRSDPQVVRVPAGDSAWVSIKAYTGRVPRRMLPLGPRAPQAGTSDDYGSSSVDELTWAGDDPRPGAESVSGDPSGSGRASNGSPKSGAAPPEDVVTSAGFVYDDGFGPLPSNTAAQSAEEGIDGPILDDEEDDDSAVTPKALDLDPEYPRAADYVQARFFTRGRGNTSIRRIVIHITDGGPNARSTANYFRSPGRWYRVDVEGGQPVMERDAQGTCRRFRSSGRWKECVRGQTRVRNGRTEAIALASVSAHYAVGQDGTVIQMVRHADRAHHAGSANSDSIGIEHCANQRNLPPSDAQYRSSAELVRWLAQQFNIPLDRQHVLGHSEADRSTTHTGCPNSVWDWDRYMSLLASGETAAQGLEVAVEEPDGSDDEEDPHPELDDDAGGVGTEAQAYAEPLGNPEYPGARDFVPARFFTARPRGRTVDRIVIHITSGYQQGPGGGAVRTAQAFAAGQGMWRNVDLDANGAPLMKRDAEGVCRQFRYTDRVYTASGRQENHRWADCHSGRTRTREGRLQAQQLLRTSAHYVVGGDGTVIQMVHNGDIAHHAGGPANTRSIGIEHCARVGGPLPTELQYRASADLVRWLAHEFNIPLDRQHIIGHSEAAHTRHSACPQGTSAHPVWNWDHYMEILLGSAGAAQGLGAGAVARPRALVGPAAAVVVPIASAITGAVMTRILNNEGDIRWELDQLRGLKHPGDDPARAGSAAYRTTTTQIVGPPTENLIGDRITANFEIRWQHNGTSLGNVDVTNVGTNDAVGWGLEVKETISDDANVHGGRAALNVRFNYRFMRAIGSDVIGILDLKLYADGTLDQDFRWTQASALGETETDATADDEIELPPPPPPRARALEGEVEVRRIGDTKIEPISGHRGEVSWQLDQLPGLKHPGNVLPGGRAALRDAPAILLDDWPRVGKATSAAFSIAWQYDGRSLGNVRVIHTGSSHAEDWALNVSAEIVDDDALHPPGDCAGLRVLFCYRFSNQGRLAATAITEIQLYGDGTHERVGEWQTSDSSVAA